MSVVLGDAVAADDQVRSSKQLMIGSVYYCTTDRPDSRPPLNGQRFRVVSDCFWLHDLNYDTEQRSVVVVLEDQEPRVPVVLSLQELGVELARHGGPAHTHTWFLGRNSPRVGA